MAFTIPKSHFIREFGIHLYNNKNGCLKTSNYCSCASREKCNDNIVRPYWRITMLRFNHDRAREATPSDRFSAKNEDICLSSHSTSSLLSPGPPAQSIFCVSLTSQWWLTRQTVLTAPDGREDVQFPDARLHASNFIIWILWPVRVHCENGSRSHGELFWVLREIKIGLGGQNQRPGYDWAHCLFKIPIVGFLVGDIAILPGLNHDQQVLGVWRRHQSIEPTIYDR